jgi:PAS domain S-box-containing protein
METKQLTQPHNLFSFIDYLAEGVLVLDHTQVAVAANQALERILGWSVSELVGKSCKAVLGCHDLASATPLCQNLCPLLNLQRNRGNHSPYFQEISVITKSGERREVSISFAPLNLPVSAGLEGTTAPPIPPPFHYLLLIRDISADKHQEQVKTQFIATASHQLRTPLASIKTAIGLLLANVGEDFSPPLLKLLENIQSSSLRMERLVNDLIELTNLQTGRVRMQSHRVEVQALVRKTVALNQPRLANKQQTLELHLPDQPLYLETDVGRISRVLSHLLVNASKFSSSGKKIALSLKPAKDAQNRATVVFSVKDEGIGIAPTEQSLIFEKFYQSQIEENSIETGNGLGLPLAKALVELNEGKLWFESEPGQGSTFYFSLPAL